MSILRVGLTPQAVKGWQSVWESQGDFSALRDLLQAFPDHSLTCLLWFAGVPGAGVGVPGRGYYPGKCPQEVVLRRLWARVAQSAFGPEWQVTARTRQRQFLSTDVSEGLGGPGGPGKMPLPQEAFACTDLTCVFG